MEIRREIRGEVAAVKKAASHVTRMAAYHWPVLLGQVQGQQAEPKILFIFSFYIQRRIIFLAFYMKHTIVQ